MLLNYDVLVIVNNRLHEFIGAHSSCYKFIARDKGTRKIGEYIEWATQQQSNWCLGAEQTQSTDIDRLIEFVSNVMAARDSMTLDTLMYSMNVSGRKSTQRESNAPTTLFSLRVHDARLRAEALAIFLNATNSLPHSVLSLLLFSAHRRRWTTWAKRLFVVVYLETDYMCRLHTFQSACATCELLSQ